MQTPSLSGPTLSGDVTDRLRAEILDGRLEPGRKLAMSDLKQRFGVGLTPIREALSRLAGERLVVTQGQRGFRVAPMSAADFDEIVMLRQMVEECGVRAAIAQGDEAWEAHLVACFHLLERRVAALADDLSEVQIERYEDAHRAFHFAILAGAGSERLSWLQQRLYEDARRYRLLFYRESFAGNAVDPAEAGPVHRELLEAVLARDGDRSAALLRDHVALIRPDELALTPDPTDPHRPPSPGSRPSGSSA